MHIFLGKFMTLTQMWSATDGEEVYLAVTE